MKQIAVAIGAGGREGGRGAAVRACTSLIMRARACTGAYVRASVNAFTRRSRRCARPRQRLLALPIYMSRLLSPVARGASCLRCLLMYVIACLGDRTGLGFIAYPEKRSVKEAERSASSAEDRDIPRRLVGDEPGFCLVKIFR